MIIIVELNHRTLGRLVDGVSDIITVGDDLLQPTSEIASELARAFARGVINFERRMITLLAMDALVPEDGIAA